MDILSVFDAVFVLEKHLSACQDGDVLVAWKRVKDRLSCQLCPSPPAADGAGRIEWLKNAQQIAITEKGTEVLLFRLARAGEMLAALAAAELGRCLACGAVLDIDGDCLDCLAMEQSHDS